MGGSWVHVGTAMATNGDKDGNVVTGQLSSKISARRLQDSRVDGEKGHRHERAE